MDGDVASVQLKTDGGTDRRNRTEQTRRRNRRTGDGPVQWPAERDTEPVGARPAVLAAVNRMTYRPVHLTDLVQCWVRLHKTAPSHFSWDDDIVLLNEVISGFCVLFWKEMVGHF